jgi:hypothetical protein
MNKRIRALACTAILTAAAAAQATTYEFSYTQLDSTVVSGIFDGTANGNLITGLSNFSVFVDSVGFANNGSLYTYGGPSVGFSGSGVMSFNGLATDIAVADANLLGGIPQSVLLIGRFNGGATDAINYNTPGVNGGEGNGDYSASRWHLAEVATAVPEPETFAMLLGGLALMGAVVRRKRVIC